MKRLVLIAALLALAGPSSAQFKGTGRDLGAPGFNSSKVASASLACSYTPVTTGTQGTAYTGATPSASGGTPAYTFSETGTLPGGLSISSSTGVISGTPSANGSFPSIQVIVTDSLSNTANCGSAFTLVIAPPTFTPASLSPAWWAEARNYSTFFQSSSGTGAAPASNGDVIGFIPDLSGNSITLKSAADNATRPTLSGVGTFPAITCTSANSTTVFNTTGLNSYNAGATSWFFATQDSSAVDQTFIAGEGLSTNSNVIYSMAEFSLSGVTGRVAGQIKNLAGTTLLATTPLQNYTHNTNHVIGLIDNGTTVTPYVDGVAGTPFTYTARTGTVTTDRFALCALVRTSTGSFWNGSIYGGVVVNRVLTSGEISNLNTYLSGLY